MLLAVGTRPSITLTNVGRLFSRVLVAIVASSFMPVAASAEGMDTASLLALYVTDKQYVSETQQSPASVPSATQREAQDSTQDTTTAVRNSAQRAAQLANMRAAIRRYRQFVKQGGWPSVKRGKLLRAGDRHARVAQLRARLAVTEDYRGGVDPSSAQDDFFDDSLSFAVRRFQMRHGLKADGVVGKSTVSAMNEAAESKLRRLRLNLDRIKQLPQHAGRHVVVNVPEYRLRLLEEHRPILSMDVVVGKKKFATPNISDKIDYLVVNPYWNVPRSIAVNEILPKVKEDPNYLAAEALDVLSGSTLVDPEGLVWSDMGPHRFPYRFRQRPGSDNALGGIKFIFPNRHNVYLHDTPIRWPFDKSRRAFSHGCIRLEHPDLLAEALLHRNARTSFEKFPELRESGAEKRINLKQSIPVDIVYLTARADSSMVWFYKDIYRRDDPDAQVNAALLGDLASAEAVGQFGANVYEATLGPQQQPVVSTMLTAADLGIAEPSASESESVLSIATTPAPTVLGVPLTAITNGIGLTLDDLVKDPG